jgi:hypothetical protein
MAAYLTVLNTRFNRSKVMKLLWLAFSLALLISPVKAQEQNDSAIRQLLSTTTTSSGQSIVLPKNNVQIVASIFDGLPSNASQAHNHPYPRYVYVLSGTLRVNNLDTGQTNTYRPGLCSGIGWAVADERECRG